MSLCVLTVFIYFLFLCVGMLLPFDGEIKMYIKHFLIIYGIDTYGVLACSALHGRSRLSTLPLSSPLCLIL